MRPTLKLDASALKPGLRLGVGVSGGADSVALLRVLAERRVELGLALHVAHLHHGLRGAEADADEAFVRALAAEVGLEFHSARVDVALEAKQAADKNAESLEEAGRRLRYAWFRKLMAEVPLDAVATAHTLDDQAETVIAKFLRGAWTEGLSGIHPMVQFPEGSILRPLLTTTRAEVEAFLQQLGQTWREDATNRELTFARNRIRHELLPALGSWNPRLKEHMAHMADLARDEEAFWDAELARIAPQLLLPGKPVRGGGRAAGDALAPSIAIEIPRLAELAVALQRRLLRHAAAQLGARPDFAATESLRMLALEGRAGQKLEVEGLRAERTHREIQLRLGSAAAGDSHEQASAPNYNATIPGVIDAPAFGISLRVTEENFSSGVARPVTLRNWRAGDRVTLRYSSGQRKIKEVLERMKVTGSARALWPVLELEGRIVWMRDVELKPEPGLVIEAIAHN